MTRVAVGHRMQHRDQEHLAWELGPNPQINKIQSDANPLPLEGKVRTPKPARRAAALRSVHLSRPLLKVGSLRHERLTDRFSV